VSFSDFAHKHLCCTKQSTMHDPLGLYADIYSCAKAKMALHGREDILWEPSCCGMLCPGQGCQLGIRQWRMISHLIWTRVVSPGFMHAE